MCLQCHTLPQALLNLTQVAGDRLRRQLDLLGPV